MGIMNPISISSESWNTATNMWESNWQRISFSVDHEPTNWFVFRIEPDPDITTYVDKGGGGLVVHAIYVDGENSDEWYVSHSSYNWAFLSSGGAFNCYYNNGIFYIDPQSGGAFWKKSDDSTGGEYILIYI